MQKAVMTLPGGRELRRLPDGRFSVQTPFDNDWVEGETPEVAMANAGWLAPFIAEVMITHVRKQRDELLAVCKAMLELMPDACNGVDEHGGDSSLCVDPVVTQARAAISRAKVG